ncbi:MAG: hypothetical protein WC356_02260 [Candidatus Micrarchaeia archaeon]|jgi:hypothetical protein
MSYADIKKLQDTANESIRRIDEEAEQRVQELYGEALTWGYLDKEPSLEITEGSIFQPMIDRLKIYPFVPKDGPDYRIFVAQYKLDGTTLKINFLGGYQVDVILMLTMIGEYSSRVDDVIVIPGDGKRAAPVSKPHFDWPEQDQDRVLLNKTGVRRKGESGVTTQFFNKTVSLGMGSPEKHWWFYVEYTIDGIEDMRFPVPGEFVSMAVKLYPGYPWGASGREQKSLPFMYSGNFIDTIYYSSAIVIEVIAPTDTIPYPQYKVSWRNHYDIIAKPSDFTEYQVGDRVTVLKDVETEKVVQSWEDEDTNILSNENLFGTDVWTLVPVSFYQDAEGNGI